MSNELFTKITPIPASAQDLFAYHEAPNAFKRLNPPWEPVETILNDGHIQDGARVHLKLKIGPIGQHFQLIHRNYQKNAQFEDHQVKGPFAHWIHRHKMTSNGSESILTDEIEYRLPLGVLGKIFGGRFARAKLERMFRYRHEVTRQDIALHQQYQAHPPMTVAITGASGLVGSQLTALLTTGGHTVKPMVRTRALTQPNSLYWNPDEGILNPDDLRGVDAIVHLAGESIAGKRWTPAQKKVILESRIKGTRLLSETLAAMPPEQRPKTLVSASAIGYYGDHGEEWQHEASPSGEGFQAEVCRAWEAALQPAIDAGIRVVILRIGVVLSLSGGALPQMLPPFLMGIGGVLGNGKQYMSWIALDDVIGIIHHALLNDTMKGVYNAVAPDAVTNYKFTKTLGRVLRRPTLAPVPPFALRLLFGKLADELLLASIRVSADKIQQAGYQFRYRTLESALRHTLGRTT